MGLADEGSTRSLKHRRLEHIICGSPGRVSADRNELVRDKFPQPVFDAGDAAMQEFSKPRVRRPAMVFVSSNVTQDCVDGFCARRHIHSQNKTR